MSFLNIDGSRKFFREDNFGHALNTPCKFGPPRSSHLRGDRFRTTGFAVYIPPKARCTRLWIILMLREFCILLPECNSNNLYACKGESLGDVNIHCLNSGMRIIMPPKIYFSSWKEVPSSNYNSTTSIFLMRFIFVLEEVGFLTMLQHIRPPSAKVDVRLL